MSDFKITRDAYLRAFETWRRVARLDPEHDTLLRSWLEHVELNFPESEGAVHSFCSSFDTFALSRRDAKPEMLRLKITKSCLLNRLIDCDEPLRTVKCPKHDGFWSGVHLEPCEYGCNLGSCSCTTGWLPSRETLLKNEKSYVEALSRPNLSAAQRSLWQKQLDAIRKGLDR